MIISLESLDACAVVSSPDVRHMPAAAATHRRDFEEQEQMG
jgi:hypothetical protein